MIVPVLELDIIQRFQPAYMNARHMSLISPAFVLLVAAGLCGRVAAAALGRRRCSAPCWSAGMTYSTVNYFTLPQYAKDNFAKLGADLAAEMQPGDGVVLVPAHMVRLYQHYLPLDALETATSARTSRRCAAGPRCLSSTSLLTRLKPSSRICFGKYKRVWLVASGMVPLSPYQDETQHLALLARRSLLATCSTTSNTLLSLKLYLPEPPILPELPANVEHRVTAVFGDKIRLDGYDIGEPLTSASATPVTLYWQPLQKIDRRYKYILRLVSVAEDGSLRTLSSTEHEPYNGSLPTTWWSPGPEIFEYCGLAAGCSALTVPPSSLRLAMQMYDAETLEKLPVTGTPEGATLADEYTVLMPFER